MNTDEESQLTKFITNDFHHLVGKVEGLITSHALLVKVVFGGFAMLVALMVALITLAASKG